MNTPKINDGGPAFPTNPVRCEDGRTDPDFYHGMSLRDWFAGQAFAGMWACPNATGKDNPGAMASVAYAWADAMLKARSQ